jgi:cell pole-organizing protein PopZ
LHDVLLLLLLLQDGVSNPLLDDYDELLTAAVDPAATIALICGTAPVLPSSSSSSIAERLQRVAAALATANTLIDELHTAPLDADQAAAMAAGSDEAAACGVSVDIYWADDSGAFYQLPRTALAALAPADLLAQLPALATAKYADSAALAKHLAAAGTTAALSVLPGGALALSGKLTEACNAAGVPLAGGSAFEGDVSKQLGRKGGPVLGRAAVLQELQALGYNTLPVLQLSMQELQGAARELRAWLQDIEADIADTIAAEQGEDAAAAVGDAEQQQDDEGDESSGSSSTLKSWVAGAQESAAPTVIDAAAAAEQIAPEEEQQPKPQQPVLVERLQSWCQANGMDSELQVFSVSGSEGGSVLGASRGHIALVSQLLDVADDAGKVGLVGACSTVHCKLPSRFAQQLFWGVNAEPAHLYVSYLGLYFYHYKHHM